MTRSEACAELLKEWNGVYQRPDFDAIPEMADKWAAYLDDQSPEAIQAAIRTLIRNAEGPWLPGLAQVRRHAREQQARIREREINRRWREQRPDLYQDVEPGDPDRLAHGEGDGALADVTSHLAGSMNAAEDGCAECGYPELHADGLCYDHWAQAQGIVPTADEMEAASANGHLEE